MIRNVVGLGRNSHVVTLPAKWIQKNKILKGDQIYLKEIDNKLMLSCEKPNETKSITINIATAKDYMSRLLFIRYIRGYDEFKIHFKNPELMPKIEHHVDLLIGMEITDQGTDYCIVSNVANELEKQFKPMFRRLFLIAMDISKKSLTAIQENDTDQVKGLINLDTISNKYTYFCLRTINKSDKDPHKKVEESIHTWALEHLIDSYIYICEDYINGSFKSISKELIEIYKGTIDLIGLFYDIFYSNDTQKLAQYRNKVMKTESMSKKLINKSDKESLVFHNLMQILYLLRHAGLYAIN